ncbi:MAG: rhodanese-like domain-containing protein [Cyclobacteriaceae bacterium]
MNDITPQELLKRSSEGEDLLIIDVREDWEYEEFNINAQHIPLHSLPHSINSLIDWQHSEIIVHCKSGTRSSQAKKLLLKNGFSNVRSLLGGIEAYQIIL